MLYNKTALTLGKLYDDASALKTYNAQILSLAQTEFYKKNIDFYGYERFVNVIQVMGLQIEQLQNKLNDFIEINGPGSMGLNVDLRV
jgi:hypothetical protein